MATGLENLEIYKLAERLEIYVYKITEKFPKSVLRIINQLRASSSSTTDNIAEFYGRYTYKDRISRLYISRGEAEETKRGIIKSYKKGLLPKKISDFCDEKYTELIKKINGYIRYLRKRESEAKEKKPINKSTNQPINQRGFTLAELLVSILIFSIITGMAIANFRGVKRSDSLKTEANALLSNIRKAQSMALAGELQNGAVPPGGYGIYFDVCASSPCSYKIFADLDGNLAYDPGEEISGGIITTANIIRISALSPAAPLTIDFKPPKPLIYINGAQTSNEAIVTITDTTTNQSKKVKLNRISGLTGIE